MFRRLKESEVDYILYNVRNGQHLGFNFFVDYENLIFHVCDKLFNTTYIAPINNNFFFCPDCEIINVPPSIALGYKFNEFKIAPCFEENPNLMLDYREALRECKELDIKVPIEDN